MFSNELTRLKIIGIYQWDYYFNWLKLVVVYSRIFTFYIFYTFKYCLLTKKVDDLKCWKSSFKVQYNHLESYQYGKIGCFGFYQYFNNNPIPYSRIKKIRRKRCRIVLVKILQYFYETCVICHKKFRCCFNLKINSNIHPETSWLIYTKLYTIKTH